MSSAELPVLDLSKANDPEQKKELLEQLHDALFNIGFLYVKNHGVPSETISNLVSLPHRCDSRRLIYLVIIGSRY